MTDSAPFGDEQLKIMSLTKRGTILFGAVNQIAVAASGTQNHNNSKYSAYYKEPSEQLDPV